MKKGLKRKYLDICHFPLLREEPCPDEEGIETPFGPTISGSQTPCEEPCPDEEGIAGGAVVLTEGRVP